MVLEKVSLEWSWNSVESCEVLEIEGISMNSGGIIFLEIGEISIEENEWSEEVSRKHEGTLRQDERSEEASLFGTKTKLGSF